MDATTVECVCVIVCEKNGLNFYELDVFDKRNLIRIVDNILRAFVDMGLINGGKK